MALRLCLALHPGSRWWAHCSRHRCNAHQRRGVAPVPRVHVGALIRFSRRTCHGGASCSDGAHELIRGGGVGPHRYAAPPPRPRSSTAPEVDATTRLVAQLQAYQAKLDAAKRARLAAGIPEEGDSDSDSDAGSSQASGVSGRDKPARGGDAGGDDGDAKAVPEHAVTVTSGVVAQVGGDDDDGDTAAAHETAAAGDADSAAGTEKPAVAGDDDEAKAEGGGALAPGVLLSGGAVSGTDVDADDVDADDVAVLAHGAGDTGATTTCGQLAELLSYKVFVWITLALSALYVPHRWPSIGGQATRSRLLTGSLADCAGTLW